MRLMRCRITRCAPHSAATPCCPALRAASASSTSAASATTSARSAAAVPRPNPPPGATSARPNPPAAEFAAVPGSHFRHSQIRPGLQGRPARRLAEIPPPGSAPSQRCQSSEQRPRWRPAQAVRQVPHYFVLPSRFRRDSDPGRSGPLAETRAVRPLGPARRHFGRRLLAARHTRRRFFRRGNLGALLFAAVVLEFDVAGAEALALGVPVGADFALSFAGGAAGDLAAFSAAGGAVIAASDPTSNFKSAGVFVSEARSISFVAGANPSWEISTR